MRLAWVTPLPPMPSGISDYSFELLPRIAERAEVDVVCPPKMGRLHRVKAPAGLRVVSPREFERDAGGYDAAFYHLGNNPWHEFVYELALKLPGVAVFHDFVMHHLLAAITVEGRRDYQRYRDLMRAEYGEAGGRLALLKASGVATDYEKFMFPLNRHIARASRAVVVHSEDSASRMRELVPDRPVAVIPHHAGTPPASVVGVDRAGARARLGLPSDAFVVGHFGFITRPKQPAAVIGGFARLAARHPDAELVMIGADNTGGGLDRLVRRYGVDGRVRMSGYVDLEEFYLYLRAVDAIINLRYPSAGESSGTCCRALAEGRVAIVNNLGSFAEIPGDVALKVEIDSDQTAAVGEHLLRVAEDPAFRAGVEANAAAYAATVLDQDRCAEQFIAVAGLEELHRPAPVPA